MKVLVTGVNGQIGHDVMIELASRGHTAIGSGSGPSYKGEDAVSEMPYRQLDITDKTAVNQLFSEEKPDALVHCSSWTAVDDAEDPANRERVFALNVTGADNLSRACESVGAKILYLSTDYVFDGHGTRPWQPDDRSFAPLNVYGQSKLGGETAVVRNTKRFFIVRISWAFGVNGKNFVKTMLRVGKNHDSVRVVDDQIGTPTYTKDLSRLLVDMIETEKYGYYHASNEGGYLSWADFTKEIFAQAGLKTRVVPVSTAEYGLSRAARPFNSRLDKSKLTAAGFVPLPDWRDALRRYLHEIGEI